MIWTKLWHNRAGSEFRIFRVGRLSLMVHALNLKLKTVCHQLENHCKKTNVARLFFHLNLVFINFESQKWSLKIKFDYSQRPQIDVNWYLMKGGHINRVNNKKGLVFFLTFWFIFRKMCLFLQGLAFNSTLELTFFSDTTLKMFPALITFLNCGRYSK